MTDTALILIDLQNDYFPTFEGAKFPLHETESASEKAAKLLAAFRDKSLTVIHVQHINEMPEAPFFKKGEAGAEIHASVAPRDGEHIVVKPAPNSFFATNLAEILATEGTRSVVIAGAMSQMCVDATSRAAVEHGFQVSVAADACAAQHLQFGDEAIHADQVHASFMGALAMGIAVVEPTEALIAKL